MGRLALSLLLVAAGACTTWSTQAGTPSQVLAARQPSTLRVTRADGAIVMVHAPRIDGDTLTGRPRRPAPTITSDPPAAAG